MTTVENAYREALDDVLPRVRGQCSMPTIAFHDVVQALEDGAWSSTTADTFSSELTSHRDTAQDHGDSCEEAFETRYAREEPQVPEDDWRAR